MTPVGALTALFGPTACSAACIPNRRPVPMWLTLVVGVIGALIGTFVGPGHRRRCVPGVS